MAELTQVKEAIGDSVLERSKARFRELISVSPEERAEALASFDAEREVQSRRLAANWRQAEAVRLSLMIGEMRNQRFETYPGTTSTQLTAKAELEVFCENVENGEIPKRGVCIYGECGSGKSGLLKATANRILDMSRPPGIVFIDCSDLPGYIERGMDIKYAAQLASIIILDDFEKGMDRPDVFKESELSKWIRGFIRRTEREQAVVVLASTNYSIKMHRERFGSAWASRLGSIMHWLPVESEDLRRKADEIPYWAR